MIRHILLIKFKATVDTNDIAKIKVLFESIPNKIDGVVNVEWGLNDSPESLNQGYSYCVLMSFANEKGRQNYLPHPEHEALKKKFVPLLDDIVVFDYQV
ncbi:Dabb family protein [Alginatibacterium sediminis]|uniref:Dabb family protein n=1 Tax=Alginatibacterium sediminis TaxID=2164068 RepID=A0A420E9T6_9ALTE|nr:Dabb family protein [Alginatibacterium sediminis]RKF17438.1 Dabb family protein [Alginatibacterium sediminis]